MEMWGRGGDSGIWGGLGYSVGIEAGTLEKGVVWPLVSLWSHEGALHSKGVCQKVRFASRVPGTLWPTALWQSGTSPIHGPGTMSGHGQQRALTGLDGKGSGEVPPCGQVDVGAEGKEHGGC